MKNKTFIIWIVIILVVFTVLFLLTGKKGSPKINENVAASFEKPFDAKATIKMKDLVMIADINKTDIGKATVTINEPKSLNGMQFQYDGDDIKVGYKGLSVKLDSDSKLAQSVAGAIVKSIDNAASPSGIDVKMDKKVITVSGQSDTGRFTIKLDKDNRSIISINMPELDFECNFNDFIFK